MVVVGLCIEHRTHPVDDSGCIHCRAGAVRGEEFPFSVAG